MRIIINKHAVQERCIIYVRCHSKNSFEFSEYLLEENLTQRTIIHICFYLFHQIFVNKDFPRRNIRSSSALYQMRAQSRPQRTIIVGKIQITKALQGQASKTIHIFVFISYTFWETLFHELSTQKGIRFFILYDIVAVKAIVELNYNIEEIVGLYKTISSTIQGALDSFDFVEQIDTITNDIANNSDQIIFSTRIILFVEEYTSNKIVRRRISQCKDENLIIIIVIKHRENLFFLYVMV